MKLTVASALLDVEDNVVLSGLRLAKLPVDADHHQLVEQQEEHLRQQHSTAVELPEPHCLSENEEGKKIVNQANMRRRRRCCMVLRKGLECLRLPVPCESRLILVVSRMHSQAKLCCALLCCR
jgi:hypothetical protein